MLDSNVSIRTSATEVPTSYSLQCSSSNIVTHTSIQVECLDNHAGDAQKQARHYLMQGPDAPPEVVDDEGNLDKTCMCVGAVLH